MEIGLVRALGWSLRDIDDTSIESLLPFIFRLTAGSEAGAGQPQRLAYCDEVSWL